jgi:septum formation protein
MPSPPNRTLILGSTSRYRRELLSRLLLPFEVASPGVDETPHPGETPREIAVRLALDKARAVAARFPQAVVIGSDQVADLAGQALGKPGDHTRATAQLRSMRGRRWCSRPPWRWSARQAVRAAGWTGPGGSAVSRPDSDDEIETTCSAEQPYDCAGSAKSEGLGIALLASIDNDDPTALIGLPLIRTCRDDAAPPAVIAGFCHEHNAGESPSTG